MAVQHHHAHMASCMAENGLNEPVIGVTFDGTGFGTDGTIWGGEFLVGDYRGFRRAAHLRPVRMPGGEQAIREPWRMAAAYLLDAGLGLGPTRSHRRLRDARSAVERMIARRIQLRRSPRARAGFSMRSRPWPACEQQVSYEGQAAIELEWLASAVVRPTLAYRVRDPTSLTTHAGLRCRARSRHAADDR